MCHLKYPALGKKGIQTLSSSLSFSKLSIPIFALEENYKIVIDLILSTKTVCSVSIGEDLVGTIVRKFMVSAA